MCQADQAIPVLMADYTTGLQSRRSGRDGGHGEVSVRTQLKLMAQFENAVQASDGGS